MENKNNDLHQRNNGINQNKPKNEIILRNEIEKNNKNINYDKKILLSYLDKCIGFILIILSILLFIYTIKETVYMTGTLFNIIYNNYYYYVFYIIVFTVFYYFIY